MSNVHVRPFGHDTEINPSHGDGQHEPVLVLFNGAYILPSSTYEKPQVETDAQIAARRAMSKRSSRSYAARVSRTRSRKKELLARPAKPTIDTSFTRHNGNAPREVFPSQNESKSNIAAKKRSWIGLGRSGTRGQGLGIMKGTPQPETQRENFTTSTNEPKTAESLAPADQAWMEISPSDRPIPIGISLPSDSLPDLSPYQTNRQRSESDATLVTPSIIITPAFAMKSVWSPDTATESEYTPSIYSRATFNYPNRSDVPPVPALPADVLKSQISQPPRIEGRPNHARNETLDSAVTAFEDMDFDIKRKERITSAATVFEEDEVPLRDRTTQMSGLSLDTSLVPTPRRSRGWWNVITTPFEFSRTNSVWTQGGRNGERTPDIPMMPQQFGRVSEPPSTPSTYIWSATEKSPSVFGRSPLISESFSATIVAPSTHDTEKFGQVNRAQIYQESEVASISGSSQGGKGFTKAPQKTPPQRQFTASRKEPAEQDIVSPLSAMSASPVIGTAAIGTVLMPRQVQEQQQSINVNIEIKDTRANVVVQPTGTSSPPAVQLPRESPPAPQVFNVEVPTNSKGVSQSPPPTQPRYGTPPAPQEIKLNIVGNSTSQTSPVQFPPPPQPRYGTPPAPQEIGFNVAGNSASQTSPVQFPPPPQPRYGTPPAPQEVSLNITGNNASQTPMQFPPPPQPRYGTPPAPQEVSLNITGSNASQTPVQFPPPPQFAYSSTRSGNDKSSRASSIFSTEDLKKGGKKSGKKHRKVFNIMDWLPFKRLPFKRDNSDNKKPDNKKQEKKTSRRQKWCWGCCCCLLILILLAIIIPVVVVVSKKNNNSSKGAEPPSATSQWLNLTGYPPIPTGISTVAKPEAVDKEDGCIAPATAWSCAVPKEDQQALSPNKPDQPNFKLEISFQNGTVDPSKTQPVRRAANPVSAGAFIRSRLLGARAAPSASPAVPQKADFELLGNTTDENQAPFEGEDTPFFISFLDAKKTTSSRLAKRADPSDITSAIPAPQLNRDGTAAPANLLPPIASNQPLRLFNRGKDDEHYGFFIYYDRAIFLKEIQKNFTRGGNPADQDGGSAFDAATMRCTWAQTRFLVQIWTKSQTTKPLLGASTNPDQSDTFTRPGSFPYPVTVTIDRHGGSGADKMAYCYEMENDGTIKKDSKDNKFFLLEDRAFGGTWLNRLNGPFDDASGPIDGGTGGCHCRWQNWLG